MSKAMVSTAGPGSAHVSCAGDGILAVANFQRLSPTPFEYERPFWRGRRNQHARRARYPGKSETAVRLTDS